MKNYKRFVRAGAWLLLAVLLLLPLSACRREEEPTSAPDTPTVTMNEKRELTYAVNLSAAVLQPHAGQTAYLYELRPGEDLTSLAAKTPLGEKKPTAKLRFQFPFDLTAESGEVIGDRLYSSYVLAFTDGTVLSADPVTLVDVAGLADVKADRVAGIKGLSTCDPTLSLELYAKHVTVEASVKELVSGNGISHTLGDKTVSFDAVLMSELDRQVKVASDAGLQVSFSLTPDAELSVGDYTAIFDFLAARYSGGENGRISSLILGDLAPRTSKNNATMETDAAANATLLRMAHLALASRVDGSCVYATACGTLAEVKAYLLCLRNAVRACGRFDFGVALSPDTASAGLLLPDAAGESVLTGNTDGETPYINLSDIPALSQFMTAELGRSRRLAVVGLQASAADPDLQSALLTYAYRICSNAGVDFMIYNAPVDDAYGLYSANLTARPAAEVYRLADTETNVNGEAMAAARLGEEWTSLTQNRPARMELADVASLGNGADAGKRLFDFSGEDAPAFWSVGSGTAPVLSRSESLNTQVLVASLTSPILGPGSGYACRLEDGHALADGYVLSAALLPQSASAASARITLRLEGTSADGRTLSYSSSILLGCNSWQVVSFHVRNFTTKMDPSAPCTVSFLMQPEETLPSSAPTESFALWLHSANVRQAAPDYTAPILVGVVVVGFAVGLVAVVLIARPRKKR